MSLQSPIQTLARVMITMKIVRRGELLSSAQTIGTYLTNQNRELHCMVALRVGPDEDVFMMILQGIIMINIQHNK